MAGAAEKLKDFGVRGLCWKNTHFLCGLRELCGKQKRRGGHKENFCASGSLGLKLKGERLQFGPHRPQRHKEIFLKFRVRNKIS